MRKVLGLLGGILYALLVLAAIALCSGIAGGFIYDSF